MVMLDLSAAFDTIDHEKLLDRLEHHFGITGTPLMWVRSYLTDRYQSVCINSETSDPVLLAFGVPQGSVMGPKKYTMYTKPLGAIIQQHGLHYHFYADDTQLYLAFKPNDDSVQADAMTKIKACIQDIQIWMVENLLKLNDDKTEVMIFHPKQTHVNDISLSVGDAELSPKASVRNLGVMLDSTLTMCEQVQAICRSGYAQLRNIGHIRRYLTTGATKTMVNSLLTSRLDYCNALLHGLPHKTLSKLQVLQNTAARIITRTSRHSHITPVLKTLHWLPIKARLQYKVALYTFKALNGLAPLYLEQLVQRYAPRRSLRSETSNTLVVQRRKTATYGDRAFRNSAPVLWNSLPQEIRQINKLNTFKKALKTHLFRECYDL